MKRKNFTTITMQERLLVSGTFLVAASDGSDQCEVITSRIDFTRISESWKDAKHDATIPPATASHLHFLPLHLPYTASWKARIWGGQTRGNIQETTGARA